MHESTFIEVKEMGWLTGFANMFDNENGRWWRTEKWMIQLTAWLVLLDLTMAFLLYVRPYITGEASSPGLVPSNVRMVSCVPGSPIDCAAMTPTDSPALTMEPRPRSRP